MKVLNRYFLAFFAVVLFSYGCAHKEPQVIDVAGRLAAARASSGQPAALAPASPVAAAQPVSQNPLPKSAYIK